MEERVKKLELIIQRLLRRSNKRVKAMVTPVPISSAAFGEDVNGPIMRYMFPCTGEIVKGVVYLSKKPKT